MVASSCRLPATVCFYLRFCMFPPSLCILFSGACRSPTSLHALAYSCCAGDVSRLLTECPVFPSSIRLSPPCRLPRRPISFSISPSTLPSWRSHVHCRRPLPVTHARTVPVAHGPTLSPSRAFIARVPSYSHAHPPRRLSPLGGPLSTLPLSFSSIPLFILPYCSFVPSTPPRPHALVGPPLGTPR